MRRAGGLDACSMISRTYAANVSRAKQFGYYDTSRGDGRANHRAVGQGDRNLLRLSLLSKEIFHGQT